MIHTWFSSSTPWMTECKNTKRIVHSFIRLHSILRLFMVFRERLKKKSQHKESRKKYISICTTNVDLTLVLPRLLKRKIVQFQVLKQLWMQLTLFYSFRDNESLCSVKMLSSGSVWSEKESEWTSWNSDTFKKYFYGLE